MASKFNVNIKGGSGSIVMGNNTVVNIRSGHEARSTASKAKGGNTRMRSQEVGEKGNTRMRSQEVGEKGNTRMRSQEVGEKGIYQETGVVRRPVTKDFPLPIHKISRGFALIIHNKYFKSKPTREGSEVDFASIMDFCGNAGLDVNDTKRETDNLTAQQIEELCTEMSKRDFSAFDGFVCFILSHGCESGIYGVDDVVVPVDKIVNLFKCSPSLVDKPKLFFIQACRGKNKDFGLEADSPGDTEELPPLHLLSDSDTLVAYSSFYGYQSYRCPVGGTWFIRALTDQLKEHAHDTHLMDILTRVNRGVACTEETGGRKQIPCQMSTLTKLVYFKYPPPLPSK